MKSMFDRAAEATAKLATSEIHEHKCQVCGETWLEEIVDATPNPNGVETIYELKRSNCACERLKKEFFEARRLIQDQQEFVAYVRKHGLHDSRYQTYTFKADDRLHPDISDKCQKYVDRWDTIRKNNMGLIFYGPVGTGKSFLACCIANALIERERPSYQKFPAVIVTTIPILINKLTAIAFQDKEDFFNKLTRAELLVIDDFGVERASEFALEQTYSVIEARERSSKPLIVTTNLSPAQFKNPPSQPHSRIYDRIYKMCGNGPILIDGESRRTDIALDKREEFDRIME